MSEKKCPACGAELAENAGKCQICGLTGLDQVFLSEEAYNDWVEHELVPHIFSHGGKGLKRTQSGALLLLDNGDLYAMGSNYSGIFGPEQPQELIAPTRIARKIKSAVLTQKHTLMLHHDGRVEILGNSSLAERFSWDLRAAKVYAHSSLEAFLLEDEEGKFYFFGDNTKEHIPLKREILMTLPPRMEAVHRSYHHLYGEYQKPWTCGHDSVDYLIAGSTWGTDVPFDESIQKKEWYRALLREYGECNVTINREILSDRTKVTNKGLPSGCEVTAEELEKIGPKNLRIAWNNGPIKDYHDRTNPYRSYGDYERVKRYDAVEMAHIQVVKRHIVLQNRMIFTPVLCEKEPVGFFDLYDQGH